MTTKKNTDIEALESDIIELVIENWHRTGKALLLSTLGATLIRRGFDLKRLLEGGRLSVFIENRLVTKVRQISPKSMRLVWGLVPADATLPPNAEDIFSKPKLPEQDASTQSVPRVLRLAFIRPLASNQIRTVDLKPKVRFQDVSEESAAASGKLTISREEIVNVDQYDAEGVAAAVNTTLSSWLKKHQIALSQLTQPEEVAPQAIDSSVASDSIKSTNLLEQLMDALTPDELRRIQIPLDVAKKLINYK